MKALAPILFIAAIIFVVCDSDAEPQPSLVRIRMEKELLELPKIPGSFLKQISDNVWNLRGASLVFNNRPLPQNNFVIKKENGKFDIIAVLEFNDYLASVLASEMPRGWPLEVFKAQAVVARSYALARIKERKSKVFHLESDQTDQVYNVLSTPKTRQAVAETNGVVLFDPKGAVLKAYYHSDCGGETVSATQVWGDRAFDSGTAKDPWCALKKTNQWKFEISKSEFTDKLEIPVLQKQPFYSGRKMQALLIGESSFSVQKLREIFGFYKIRSSADSMEISNSKVKITGQGFGHGVGLCQWGALAQVKLGKSYIKVIEHYYPRAQIVSDSSYLSLNLQSKNLQSENLHFNSVSN